VLKYHSKPCFVQRIGLSFSGETRTQLTPTSKAILKPSKRYSKCNALLLKTYLKTWTDPVP